MGPLCSPRRHARNPCAEAQEPRAGDLSTTSRRRRDLRTCGASSLHQRSEDSGKRPGLPRRPARFRKSVRGRSSVMAGALLRLQSCQETPMQKNQSKENVETPKAKSGCCGCCNTGTLQDESKSKATKESAEQPSGASEESCCDG